VDIVESWHDSIKGLCEAYFTLGSVITRDNWFHSRDLVFLMRYLRRAIGNTPPAASLFSAELLISGLRRNFQNVDASQFPRLAKHVHEKCVFRDISPALLTAQSILSLRESLNDEVDEDSDASTTHCRYTLVVDPTDSETAIDLLFSMNLLDQQTTTVVTINDFPEDALPTKQILVLAQIKSAIEKGDCLLLKNSSVLQSALYDVINRHYAISVNTDSADQKVSREAYANISLGSFSRYVKVHPKSRLIVHIPESQLCVTPLPFLNRFEKFSLSIRDALSERITHLCTNPPNCFKVISTPDLRRSFLRCIESGMLDFVEYLGGSSSFYGLSIEAVSATLLQSLSDENLTSLVSFGPIAHPLSEILRAIKQNQAQASEESSSVTDYGVNSTISGHIAYKISNIIRLFNFQLLHTARIESIFQRRHRLPAVYLREFLDRQEHLSVACLIDCMILRAHKVIDDGLIDAPTKLVVYTRTGNLHVAFQPCSCVISSLLHSYPYRFQCLAAGIRSICPRLPQRIATVA
jgi:hypothetical protein